MPSTKPLSVVPRSISRMVRGATIYPKARVNTDITLDNGYSYTVFREVVMKHNPPTETGGVFRVWFYAVTTPRQTILMSHMTKLFFVGMPGFRGKIWCLNKQTGEFGGIYQFDTAAQAQAYAESFAMQLSKRRARPGLFGLESYAKQGEASLFKAHDNPIIVPGQAAVGNADMAPTA